MYLSCLREINARLDDPLLRVGHDAVLTVAILGLYEVGQPLRKTYAVLISASAYF